MFDFSLLSQRLASFSSPISTNFLTLHRQTSTSPTILPNSLNFPVLLPAICYHLQLNKFRCKKRGIEESIEMIIPQDLMIEILSWLPFTSLLCFESVCTNWLYLFTKDSNFQRLHSERCRKNPTAGISSQLKASCIMEQIKSQPEILAKIYYEYTYWKNFPWNGHEPQRPNVLLIAPEREVTEILNMVCHFQSDYLSFPYTVDIMAGDPTFLCQLLLQQLFRFKYIDLIVLFELDEMLSRGFRKQINFIFQFLPKEVKVKKISATMPLVSSEILMKEMILKKAITEAELYVPSFKLDNSFMKVLMGEVDREELLKKEACRLNSYQEKLFPKEACRLNSDKRKKKSTISWNPHLKMHR